MVFGAEVGYNGVAMEAKMTVEEIEKLVEGLPTPDFKRFVAWLDDYRAEAWDRQIEADAKAGRLDHLIAAAKADIDAGRIYPL